MNLDEFSKDMLDRFSDVETLENHSKGIIIIGFDKNNATKEIEAIHCFNSNKIDMVEVVIMMLKEKKMLEIQNIFEAVKEHI